MNEQENKLFDRANKIEHMVERVVYPLNHFMWLSVQQDKDGNKHGYGFAYGGKYAYMSNEDLETKTDDELIRDCARQLLGCELDSAEHIQMKIDHLENFAKEERRKIEDAQKHLSTIEQSIVNLKAQKIEALQQVEVSLEDEIEK